MVIDGLDMKGLDMAGVLTLFVLQKKPKSIQRAEIATVHS
jgi:hypothetical protein